MTYALVCLGSFPLLCLTSTKTAIKEVESSSTARGIEMPVTYVPFPPEVLLRKSDAISINMI